MPVSRVSSPLARRALLLTALVASLGLLCISALGPREARGLTIVVAPTVDTAIVGGPAEGATIEEDHPTFAFEATRDGRPFPEATFRCSVDGAPAQPCASPIAIGPLEEGAHSFAVYAEDAPNFTADPEPARRSFVVAEEEGCEEFEDEDGLVEEECEDEEAEAGPLPPEECVLRSARARLFAYTAQDKVRLVIRYTSFEPADVTVEYRLGGARGPLRLASIRQRFARKGQVRATERLTPAQMEKVRSAKRFTVTFGVAGTPRYCDRYETRQLTVRRTVHGQLAWFQSGSIFGT